MIRTIFLFITLYLSTSINCFSQNCDYGKYYELIELAQKEYQGGNLKVANNFFKEAFETTNFPFGKHLFTALKVADEIKDKIHMEKICIQLAKGGIPLKFFKKFERQKWYLRFYEQFPNYQKYFNDNFDSELRKLLINLEKYDKEVNDRFHEWRTREVNHSTDTLVDQMTKVSDAFQRIVNKFGFPSEKKFGYYFKAGSVVELPTFVLLVHIYGRGELLYIDQLNDLACNGNLTKLSTDQLYFKRGLGDSTGIKQNMEACEKKYRKE